MKKPKKIAAKPPAGETPPTPAKSRKKSPKTKAAALAASSEPVKPPKKPPGKRLHKSTTKAVETTPPVEIKSVAETKPVVEAKAPAKPKRVAKTKAAAKITPAPIIEPAPEIKPTAEMPPAPAKPKRAAKTKVAAKITAAAAAEPAPELKPAAELPPAVEAKPKRAKPRAKAKPPVAPAAPVVTQPPSIAPRPPTASTPASELKQKMEQPIPPAPTPVKRATRPARKTPSRIPPILLEGDRPSPASPPISGPGQRYALGPTPPIEKLRTEGELPESYGTETLLLTARDPHWLYTHWDLPADQQRRYNAYSRDGHLVVRIYVEVAGGKPVVEIHVHPESRHWFVHVERANTRYVAELGYYSAAEKWTVVATSAATLTPPDAVSTDTTAEFGVIPIEVPMERLLSLVKEAVHESAPLARALQELRADGHAELPAMVAQHAGTSAPPGTKHARGANGKSAVPWKPSEWTPAQERALAKVISMDHVRRVWMGSLEITELIRRQLLQEAGPAAAPGLGAVSSAAPAPPAEAVTGISSPVRKAARQKGFWFNVNAELIVYGATEPDATVSIGGRKIKLRPDGSFSYRFALPDGNYEMPVVAISADQSDGRAADLKFSRRTEYRGDVGAHPQDPALRPMGAGNF